MDEPILEKEIHDELVDRLSSLGVGIVPYGMNEGVFPFIQIGEVVIAEEGRVKMQNSGKVTQYIHIWHNDLNELGTVYRLKNAVTRILKSLRGTTHYQLETMPYGLNIDNMVEDTGTARLRRCTIDIEYQYYEKGVLTNARE